MTAPLGFGERQRRFREAAGYRRTAWRSAAARESLAQAAIAAWAEGAQFSLEEAIAEARLSAGSPGESAQQ